MKSNPERCQCRRCRTERRLDRIAKKLPKRDAHFIRGLFAVLMERQEADFDQREDARKN